MNKERLIELKRVLENVPEQKFNMYSWIYQNHSCETVACALGWAAMHPPFNAQGLGLTTQPGIHPYSVSSTAPVFGEWVGYAAAEFFFDIPGTISYWLFDPEEYEQCLYHDEEGNHKVTPADVIARIDIVLVHSYHDKPVRELNISGSDNE